MIDINTQAPPFSAFLARWMISEAIFWRDEDKEHSSYYSFQLNWVWDDAARNFCIHLTFQPSPQWFVATYKQKQIGVVQGHYPKLSLTEKNDNYVLCARTFP